jgi:hypothetical protein
VSDKSRKTFSNIDTINENSKIQIAVLKGSAFESTAKELFPSKDLVLIESYQEFDPQDTFTALLWEEQEAIAWSMSHRGFKLVYPQPPMGYDTIAYPIRNDSPRFIHYLDQWLELKKSQGFTEKQYELWIKGKTEIAAPYEPRWSIVRNVLHWVD